MEEYYGKSATVYQQTKGKNFLLFPAIKRFLSTGGNFLDIGCGNADLGSIAKENNFDYYGIDISEDMLNKAKQNYPEGKFFKSSSSDFSLLFNFNFDVIVLSMLFPAFSNYSDIVKTLNECRQKLNDNGRIIIGVTHPAFDQYMQSGLLGRKNIDTEFNGYFDSGKKFLIHKKFDDATIIFEDFHWTFSDYFNAIKEANLRLIAVDECSVDISLANDEMFAKERNKFPTYLVFLVQKL